MNWPWKKDKLNMSEQQELINLDVVSGRLQVKPGDIVQIPYEPKPEPPKDPEPDLSTKPKDIVGYCFGFACPKKHVQETFEKISVDEYKQRQACNRCGSLSKPAVVKRTAEAVWKDVGYRFTRNYKPNWEWNQLLWNHFEFVRYLDEPKKRGKK